MPYNCELAAVADLGLQNFKTAQKMIKERKVESNVSAAIVGNTLLGAVPKCSHFWKMVTKNYYKCGWCDERHYC